jgi:hypothetical protein
MESVVTFDSIKRKKVLSNTSLGIVGNRELTMQTYINPFCDEDDVMVMNIFIVHEVGRIEDTCFINCVNLKMALDFLNTDRLC